jgi:hypothetical protein
MATTKVPSGIFGKPMIFPCWKCGAADARDAAHQRGCPRLPPVSAERLLAIAKSCERGWAEAEAVRRERIAERAARQVRERCERRVPQAESARAWRAGA